MNKDNLKPLASGELASLNQLVQPPNVARSPSPSNVFPGNRLQGDSGATSAPAKAQAAPAQVSVATQAQQADAATAPWAHNKLAGALGGLDKEMAAQTRLNAVLSQSGSASTAQGTMSQHPMTSFDRSGMTNAQVAEANPAGKVTVQRQANGNMSFSAGNVSGTVSYVDRGSNPLAGGGLGGNGFRRVDSAPAGAHVAMDGSGNYAFSSNPIAAGAGGPAPAGAGSSAVDAALSAAAARGDFDAVRAHYAGRGQGFGGQSAGQIQQGQQQAGFSGVIGGGTLGFDPARRNAQFDRDQLTRTIMDPNTKRSQRAALTSLAQMDMQSASNAQRLAAEERMGAASHLAAMDRTNVQEQGANSRQMAQLLMKQQDDSRASTYQAAQLDFSRQRLALDQERAARDGLPQGYRRTGDGGLEPIPGGPQDPAVLRGKATLNDVQSKALQFGARMLQSGQALDQLSEQGVSQPGYIKRAADVVGAGALANWTQSPQQQQVEQSQRDYVNAVLRRESGAAISNSEFDNARKQYFPQPGDSAQVIEQKRRNRELATQGVLAEVPDQQTRVQQVLGAAGQGQQRTVVRTGTANGRKVLQYSDGSISYAD